MHALVRLDHALLAVDREHDVHAMLETEAPEAPGDDGVYSSLSISPTRRRIASGPS